MARSWRLPIQTRSLFIGSCLVAVGAAAAGWWWQSSRQPTVPRPHGDPLPATTPVVNQSAPATDDTIEFPRESWSAADVAIAPARQEALSKSVRLTGKIALNEDHVAHIFPLVEGRVDEVKVQFGDRVKKGDLLVVVQSREVGQAMLQLYQDRLERDFAVTKDRWTQEVSKNTQELIKLIRGQAKIEDIEEQLRDRPMGEYRDKLMTAYIGLYKSQLQLKRLSPLSEGVVSGRLMLDAETEHNVSRATLQSLVEQIEQDARQDAIVSSQAVKESQIRVAVDETNLKILGFDDAELKDIDPARQGEALSHYPISSPFDGTIITKDVVLLERIGPESQILSIADLSTVWVSTDIYEEHLPLLAQLGEQMIHLTSDAWPGRTFEAKIFYTGDVVHESTRTIAMKAIAENDEGLLKPGMFVNVELPLAKQAAVVQVPKGAINEHEGKSFVFVHLGDDRFARRLVKLGRSNEQSVEIVEGLQPGEPVAVRGTFALKSRMLAELLSE